HRANQNLPPETIDRVRSLPFLQQPVQHADAVQVLALGAFATHGQDGAGDHALVVAVQAVQAQERPREVKGRPPIAAPQNGYTSARFQEVKLAVKLDAVAHSQAIVEVEQVHAAAEQNVLTVVDGLGLDARRGADRVRRGAAAEKGPCFKQVHLEAG